MKAAYKGSLYSVVADDGEGVQLERLADLGARPFVITVPYSDPDLMLDPTDDEVRDCDNAPE